MGAPLDFSHYGLVLLILGGLLSVSILADIIAARTAILLRARRRHPDGGGGWFYGDF